MTERYKIWIDDERKPLPSFNTWFKIDFSKFIPFVIENYNSIESISFDNSLGCDIEGHQLLTNLELEVCAEGLRLPYLNQLTIHTADSNKWLSMGQTADKIISHNGNGEWWQENYASVLTGMRERDETAYWKWCNDSTTCKTF